MKRTSAGLRDLLFNAIESVKNGDMDFQDAAAIAKLARGICETAHLEIEVAKLRMAYPSDAKLIVPSPLQLSDSNAEKNEK